MRKKPLILSVTSGRGGVEKTFATVNLATALAKSNKKVLVFDCDRGLAEYDIILLDTGAGISEVVLQFNLLASKNIFVINIHNPL